MDGVESSGASGGWRISFFLEPNERGVEDESGTRQGRLRGGCGMPAAVPGCAQADGCEVAMAAPFPSSPRGASGQVSGRAESPALTPRQFRFQFGGIGRRSLYRMEVRLGRWSMPRKGFGIGSATQGSAAGEKISR